MAFALMTMKILAFSDIKEVRDRCFSKKVSKNLVFEEAALENLWRFGRYAVCYYVPYFLLSSSGRDAAIHDLQLYKSLLRFRAEDKELADSALATLNRHLWYLAPHTVMFALFSNKVRLY
jgi:hypothetical protein